ncbi:hypothetical protein Syn7502_03049 [Synechococcus sp. PCC 7502]|uniref:hypothetical protein n=1 Tax=Synechococcus sp. PCC 7502 TaxID=1173263 RepID=UPI00029FF56C|nr:hypothetical protein [Synechococcus sp. PCC 7502]AFY74951.1 hypothetical protein Syn7502_03049 [Synechococcus sp. PCC 7502]
MIKKIFLFSLFLTTNLTTNLFLVTNFGYSQSGNPKFDALLNQVQAKPGSIHWEGKGALIEDKASLVKGTNGIYVLGSHLSLSEEPSQVHLAVSEVVNGVVAINQRSFTAIINGPVYEVSGKVTFKVVGKSVSGTFTGDLYEIKGKKAKAEEKSSGKIAGNFTGLTLK